jgi:hypothetical protein
MGLVEIRKSSVGAEQSRYFLNTAKDAVVNMGTGTITSGTFNMMFLMAENNNVETGASLETVADVTQKVQPSEPSYEGITIPYSGLFLKEDPVCQALETLYRTRPVGDAAHFYMIEEDKWSGATGKFYIADVAIVVTGITNEAGDKRRVEATIGLASDWKEVSPTLTVDENDGTITVS